MENQWIPIPVNEAQVTRMKKELNIPSAFCRLLLQRGIDTKEKADQFFNPSLEDLHDPFLMQGMGAAVSRLKRAINNGERILLYGDYDVDGTCSVAMMHTFLEPRHDKLDYYIPDRYKEGYGISMEGIDYASQNGITLIIAMDCGIKAVKQVEEAAKRKIDVIICDHHQPEDERPKAIAVLDPKQETCEYPYKELCGCGVTFKFIQAYCLYQEIPFEKIQHLLDFVVTATACDIVPLSGENRILAYYGLKRLNENPRLGLEVLIRQSGRNRPLMITDIVFGIGPMINAVGRLGDAKQAVRLLLAKEMAVAEEFARFMEGQNEQRKEFDKTIVQEAEMLIEEFPSLEERKSIVLYQPHWHKGIIGIAASRIVEKYYRPTIIFTESNGKIVGSARSVPGLDIYQVIKSCENLLLNFGGHQYAAGMTMDKENYEAFTSQFETAVKDQQSEAAAKPKIAINAELPLEAITPKFWTVLKQFAPFGPQNRNPVFISRNVRDTGFSKLVKEKHLRLAIRQSYSKSIYGIAFNQGASIDQVQKGPFHLCYNIQENHWNGKMTLQLQVKDLKFEEI